MLLRRPIELSAALCPVAPLRRLSATWRGRSAFTLIELLVAISILLILATMTFTMMNVTMKGDQIRAAARQMQSYLEGARDRAIHAGAPRGVRFLKDPNNQNTVNAMVFIGAADIDRGNVQISGATPRNLSNAVGSATIQQWEEYYERGLLGNKADVEATPPRPAVAVPIQLGPNLTTHTMVRVAAGDWRLTRAYTSASASVAFVLQLNPEVLPNQEPRLLPSGIMIDLPHSQLPSFWGTSGSYSSSMDILFSPRGPMTGLAASAGNIHFLLADVRDITRNIGAVQANGTQDPNNVGDKLLVTITTQTGKISSHPIYYLSDAEVAASNSPDPFRFAELGEEAK